MVQITQNTNGNGLIWAVMESGCDLVKKSGILCQNKILLKAHFLRYQPNILNTTCSEFWLSFSFSFRFLRFWKKKI